MNYRHLSLSALSVVLSVGLLSGCGQGYASLAAPTDPLVTGNWQLSSVSSNASKLPALSGEISGTPTSANAIFHSNSTSACVAPTSPIELSGSANGKNVFTLTGSLAGGTLTVTGTLAPDGKSLTNATYNVSGGTCAFPAPAPADGQNYTSVTGNFAGNFADPGGNVISITAVLSQTPNSDTDGNFQLSGTGTFPTNPCFISPVSVTNSQVTGGSFTLTYTDTMTTNSVTASGTFSTDGTTLTVTNWTLTGPCGPDSGTGLLTKQ